MSDIAKRLRASVRMDAINGDGAERSVCGRQMLEAAAEIDRLESMVSLAQQECDGLRNKIAEELGEDLLRDI